MRPHTRTISVVPTGACSNGTAVRQRGFSIIELAVVIVILSLLLGAVLVPLNTQLDRNRVVENTERIALAREALIGYAIAHGRLPCPDDPATTATGFTGQEEFALSGGSALNGQCKVWDGLLPGKTLGLSNVDSSGTYLDGWGSSQNRMRYAVTSRDASGGSGNPTFTRTNGIRAVTFAQLAAGPYLRICNSGTGITSTNCGTAQELNEGRSLFLVYSLGKNAQEILSGGVTPSTDEAANLNGDLVFVSHDQVAAAGSVFDDQLEWVSVYQFLDKLVSSGTLP